jgi:hypothetical protein
MTEEARAPISHDILHQFKLKPGKTFNFSAFAPNCNDGEDGIKPPEC